jgi:hypothetical protein
MKTINNYLKPILVILCLVVLSSCRDDEKPSQPVQKKLSNEEIVSQKWKLDKITFNGQSENVSPYSMEFKPDKNFIFQIPSIHNLPTSGKWALIDQTNKEIILNNTIKLKANPLTENLMVLEYNYKNHKEGDVAVIFTFIK